MSDKSVAERLQAKNGRHLAVLNAPKPVDADIGAPRATPVKAEVVLLFAADLAALKRDMPALLKRVRSDAILWLAYPKLTSKLAGNLNRNLIHDTVPAYGLDTVAQIAIDADWSALRFKRIA